METEAESISSLLLRSIYFFAPQVLSSHSQKILLCCSGTADLLLLETVPLDESISFFLFFFFFLDESISWTVSLSDHPRSVSFLGSLSWSLFSYGQVLFTSPCPHSSVSWHPLHLYVSNCHKAISLWCFKLTAFFQSSSLFCDPLLGIIDPSENLIKTMELLPQKNVQIFSYNSRALLDLPGTHTPLI